MLDDADLLRRSIGDPDLFEEIFGRHYDSILRYGRQRLGHDVGEEIAARTMVIAFERRASFDGRFRSARPWLFGIATNLIRHHARDERIHMAALARLPIDPDLRDEEPLDRLEAIRRRPSLLKALMELAPGDRDAFTLLALSDLTYAEVANALGIPEGTVGSRIHRARRSHVNAWGASRQVQMQREPGHLGARETTMADLEELVKRAIGDPPPDRQARERALLRLRAEIAERREEDSHGAKTRSVRLRVGVASIAGVLLVLLALSIVTFGQPAVADELDRLAQSSVQTQQTGEVLPIRIEQMSLAFGGDTYGGLSYAIEVRSNLTRTMNPNGSVLQTTTITSADFVSEADREAWKAMGSPERPRPGDVVTDPFPGPLFDIAAIPTDPEALRQALLEGKITGYQLKDEQVFDVLVSLLMEPGVSSEQRVALYQVIALFDGVELLGETVDPLGRIGVGFSRTVSQRRQVLIFDPDTGLPLATEELPLGATEPPLQWLAFQYPQAKSAERSANGSAGAAS